MKFFQILVPFFIALISYGFIAGCVIPSLAQDNKVKLELAPKNISSIVGDNVNFDINLISGAPVTAAEIRLEYDPKKLEAISIKEGSVLPVVLTPGQVGGGNASIALGANINAPANNGGKIATVVFKVKSADKSNVNISQSSQVAISGQTANALSTTSGATVEARGGNAASSWIERFKELLQSLFSRS